MLLQAARGLSCSPASTNSSALICPVTQVHVMLNTAGMGRQGPCLGALQVCVCPYGGLSGDSPLPPTCTRRGRDKMQGICDTVALCSWCLAGLESDRFSGGHGSLRSHSPSASQPKGRLLPQLLFPSWFPAPCASLRVALTVPWTHPGTLPHRHLPLHHLQGSLMATPPIC